MDEAGYLDTLQEPMEEIALGKRPNTGRFCGHCYVRIEDVTRAKGKREPARCSLCGVSTAEVRPVTRVPPEVLALYLAKRKREGLFVNAFAMSGILLSMVLSAVLWFVLPSGWLDILPFAMLLVGSYYFARLLGLGIGAELGYNSGRSLRDRRWSQYLAQRALAASATQQTRLDRRDVGSVER